MEESNSIISDEDFCNLFESTESPSENDIYNVDLEKVNQEFENCGFRPCVDDNKQDSKPYIYVKDQGIIPTDNSPQAKTFETSSEFERAFDEVCGGKPKKDDFIYDFSKF